METSKKTTSKKKVISEDSIISMYMNDVLSNNSEPKNVFCFCKDQSISETDFYKFFNSLDALKKIIWVKFLENAVATIKKDEAFEKYSDKNKLLTLYFTLFEILTLNRSFVLFSLSENKQGLKSLATLKEFRNSFKLFIVSIIENDQQTSNEKIKTVTKPLFSEGAYIQFLFLLKFWMDDTSKEFEKTDILIEKSVNTVVDLLNTKPLESLLDLGKFLWKEKMN